MSDYFSLLLVERSKRIAAEARAEDWERRAKTAELRAATWNESLTRMRAAIKDLLPEVVEARVAGGAERESVVQELSNLHEWIVEPLANKA